MSDSGADPWKISLHGGHCGAYCNHAKGTLREVLEAAADFGYQTFGVSEHAPRLGAQFLHSDERARGWDVAKLRGDFERYASDLDDLRAEFSDRLTILKGMEIEVVPNGTYSALMLDFRKKYSIEFIVGSVHYVDEISIDGDKDDFERVVDRRGGLDNFAVAYYEAVAEMVEALKPEVVGHLDLIRKNAPSNEAVETLRIRDAARECLKIIKRHGGILDVNTAGYRKGLGSPYPAAWLVRDANELGVPFCFGDDSHGPSDVGAGILDARDYLLENGVETITSLAFDGDRLSHAPVPLR